MIDDVSDIQDLYDGDIERELTRLDRHPIERDITWHYLDTYLPPSGKILEVGAAVGGYTVPLARKGYTVTAADLSPAELEVCRQRLNENGLGDKATCVVADARDLSVIRDADYDAALVMGPLYHLVYEEDRITALKEVYDRLKPGGVIFSAFISRYGIWASQVREHPELIENTEDLRSILENGRDLDSPNFDVHFRGYFATIPEIAPLHEEAGFETLVIAGVEPVGVLADEDYGKLPENQRELWLDLLVRISAEPSILGASCHLLYVGRKG
ncbi:MAG: class I SAM-dependent methyltransferase [Dehalococcoidales bacterium]|nr:class I SAM-dependent methyltransferase [Dehalococcoidales bacterium]